MMRKYFPAEFEQKWTEKWKQDKLYQFKLDETKEKFYNLVELPYTSGDLHIGHWFAFSIPDVLARFKRMNGFNVFYPNGYDAFGLPAENAAMKRNIHPQDWTMSNIANMNKQFSTMGTMIDWDHTAVTCLPEYYGWNQWIFIKMFEKDLAYRGKALSNWCEKDQTVLANENIENGKCWRCGTPVIQKEVEQWFLKITDYADQLLWTKDTKVDWPESVKVGQNNWIGRSEGMEIDFPLKEVNSHITVFTTRPDTIDGATFLVVAPENLIVSSLVKKGNHEVVEYVAKAKKKTEEERKIGAKEKTGVFSGLYAINPYTNKEIPVWIADYVLVNYGTGAIMAVPAEDERDREFATKFNLPIEKSSCQSKPQGKKRVIYHIHDWSISRQRYWGTPVPMIHCDNCGIVPVPEKDLPVELPYDVDFTPHGKPPLATNEQWLKVSCPKCGGDAKRDAETLDTFFDSAWYYYRYVSPHYTKAPFDKELVKKLMPVNVYFGGAEHTLGHTLYARFFTKFFKDLGLVDFDEFALKRMQHGVILGPDGYRMSKSRGNVINPDDVVKEYGADTVRLYLAFMMPYEATAPWSTTAIAGVYRFLKRVWEKFQSLDTKQSDDRLVKKLNQTIYKVESAINEYKFNTAVAFMMEFMNDWDKSNLNTEGAKKFLRILAPFAPFMAEEIWQVILGEKQSIHLSTWPKVDQSLLQDEEVIIPIQVNGKVRATVTVSISTTSEDQIVKEALKNDTVKKWLDNKQYKVVYIKGRILNFIII